MKEAFERPIAESNNGQKRNELEFHTLKFWFLYAYCIIIIIIIISHKAIWQNNNKEGTTLTGDLKALLLLQRR